MKTMPKTTSEEKYRWIKPILDKEITINNFGKIKNRLNKKAIYVCRYRIPTETE